MSAIPPIGAASASPIQPTGGSNAGTSIGTAKNKSEFSNLIDKVVGGTNEKMQTAEQSVADLTSGKTDNMQDVVMSMAKADLSFRFVLEMRNKLMEAYQEIMRMQV